MNISQVVSELEAAGAALRLDGERVRIWYPDEELRSKLTGQVAWLRQRRGELSDLLKFRNCCPPIPAGVRLVSWNLKQPPVLVECSAVVTDPGLFARTTLEQLRIALAAPKRWVGWTIPQLIDRLAQVGVRVALESAAQENFSKY
jgi:hypothetical protein